ncbi:MAG: dicarboxylate/amino acid:cation symporter [Muribaculaceae bacterium]|nr:dicarboxylate/amino acid:cation symporter [Muribaculaceae bacterium]
MKIGKIGLLPLILIAIVTGALLGTVAPEWLTRLFATFNGIFANFLAFFIPLLIIGLVTPAIADVGRSAGKMLLITALIAYGNTVFSGFFSYVTSTSIFPSVMPSDAAQATANAPEKMVEPFFVIGIKPMFDVLAALVFSFIMGLGMAYVKASRLKMAFNEFKAIVEKTINFVIIPLLPIFIFGMFLIMSATGKAWNIASVFISVIGIIFAMHIVLLLFQYLAAGAIAKRNPFKALWHMLPAYFTALGTSSSAATIPVTLRCAKKNNVNEDIADFVIPLCATIHLSGSAMKITACAIALMLMQNIPVELGTMTGFILMLGVMMVAAPGVPGGAIMAAVGVLQSVLGFNEEQTGLMITLYIAMDSFGTACNVTGDGAIAVVINKLFHKKKAEE